MWTWWNTIEALTSIIPVRYLFILTNLENSAMIIKIIQPYIPAQALFTHQIADMARFSTQLGPLIIAALTPDKFEVEFVNEQIEEIDYDEPVDIIGISTLTANSIRAYAIGDRFREKGATVVMGGIHASFLPEEAIHHCDAVVIGEAEYTWPILLEDWRKWELKPFYKSDRLTNMADVPIPRRGIDLTVGYIDKIEASRGCPFDCDFCSTNIHFGRKHRIRPIQNVLDDIHSTHRNRIHSFMFSDDNIVGNPKYAEELFRALKPLKINWTSQCSTNIADSEKLLKLASGSGCKGLSIGFESFSTANLREAGKRHNRAKNYDEQIRKLRDAGIWKILANFVFGFDHDDQTVFERTVEFILRHKLDAYFTILTPYPKTGLRERLLREGRILHSDWSRYDTTHCVIRPKLMEPDEVEEGLRWAYQQIYPGKEMIIEDPKELHRDNKLSEVTNLLLTIKKKREVGYGYKKR
jgi:radical SAM superfamily enzyme YgiQ (UPF0313 family)